MEGFNLLLNIISGAILKQDNINIDLQIASLHRNIAIHNFRRYHQFISSLNDTDTRNIHTEIQCEISEHNKQIYNNIGGDKYLRFS